MSNGLDYGKLRELSNAKHVESLSCLCYIEIKRQMEIIIIRSCSDNFHKVLDSLNVI